MMCSTGRCDLTGDDATVSGELMSALEMVGQGEHRSIVLQLNEREMKATFSCQHSLTHHCSQGTKSSHL